MKKNLLKIVMAAIMVTVMLALAACGSKTVGGNDGGNAGGGAAPAGSSAVVPAGSSAQEAKGSHKMTFIIESEIAPHIIDVKEEISTDAKTFGDFLRTYKDCDWEDSSYGIFVKSFQGVANDDSQEIWWQLFVNGESAMEGADFYEIKDGDEYKYVLTKGYDW